MASTDLETARTSTVEQVHRILTAWSSGDCVCLALRCNALTFNSHRKLLLHYETVHDFRSSGHSSTEELFSRTCTFCYMHSTNIVHSGAAYYNQAFSFCIRCFLFLQTCAPDYGITCARCHLPFSYQYQPHAGSAQHSTQWSVCHSCKDRSKLWTLRRKVPHKSATEQKRNAAKSYAIERSILFQCRPLSTVELPQDADELRQRHAALRANGLYFIKADPAKISLPEADHRSPKDIASGIARLVQPSTRIMLSSNASQNPAHTTPTKSSNAASSTQAVRGISATVVPDRKLKKSLNVSTSSKKVVMSCPEAVVATPSAKSLHQEPIRDVHVGPSSTVEMAARNKKSRSVKSELEKRFLKLRIARHDRHVDADVCDKVTVDQHSAETHRSRVCSICTDELPSSLFLATTLTSRCSHGISVCRQCARNWISAQLETSLWNNMTCCHADCNAILQYNDVERHARSEDFQRYESLTLRAGLAEDQDFVWCPAPDCNAGQIHVDGQNAPIFHCQACGFRYCVTHSEAWHDGETCTQYDQRLQAARLAINHRVTSSQVDSNHAINFHASSLTAWLNSFIWTSEPASCQPDANVDVDTAIAARLARQQEEELGEAAVKKLAKQCPKCQYYIEKHEGCDHMTCRKCKHQFCWLCLADYMPIKEFGNRRHAASCRYHA